MSDGLSWAYEQLEKEKKYKAHIESGKFDKYYLEQDIVRTLTSTELRLLVVRLIIHYLGGFKKFISKERYCLFDLFEGLSKKEQKHFVTNRAEFLGMEVGYSRKLRKLRTKIEALLKH